MNAPIEEKVILDHEEMRSNYQEYKMNLLDRNECKKFYNLIVWELCRHSIAEEIILYPLIRQYVPNGDNLINENIEQHRKIKQEFNDLESMNISNEYFDVRLDIAMEELLNHFKMEESEELAKLVLHCPKEERINSGHKFDNRKKIAPTHPHTMTSDKYPMLETFQGLLLAPIDKFKDMFKDYPEEKSHMSS